MTGFAIAAKKQEMRIGILVDYYVPYQQSIALGVQSVLSAAGHVGITIVGRELVGKYANSAEVYKLATAKNLDGVVVLTATICANLSAEEIQNFCEGIPLPMVSIGPKVEGILNVSVDNRSGMRQLMAHLISARGRERFVFVRGTALNVDSEIRENIFREAIAENGLKINEKFFLEGNFDTPVAMRRMSDLLKTDRDFDAVVCANDSMALGVIDALEKVGICVPKDVSVVGFDDSGDASLSSIPLTTVKSSPFNQGAQAAELLLKLLSSEKQEIVAVEDVSVMTQMVLRESCGADLVQDSVSADAEEELFINSARAILPDVSLEWARRLRTLCLEIFLGDPIGLVMLDKHWRFGIEQSDTFRYADWSRLSSLAKGLLEAGSRNMQELVLSSSVYSQFQAGIADAERRHADQDNRIRYRIYHQVTHFNIELMAVRDEEEIASVLTRNLPFMGCEGFFLCLNREAQTSLLLQFLDGKGETWVEDFPRGEILSNRAIELLSGNWILFPLFDAEHFHGFMITDAQPDMQSFYESLRHNISSALRNIHQVRGLEQHASELELRINERTLELKEANSQLRAEVSERSKAESDLTLANARLHYLANHDALTGVANRSAFDQYLSREWAVHSREDRRIGVLMCDLDSFKEYNDTYGHLEGDKILQTVSSALSGLLRQDIDLFARFGGEEFAVVLPFTDEVGVRAVGEKLRTAIDLLNLESTASAFGKVTISVGGFAAKPSESSIDELLKIADDALYVAKRNGRNLFAYGDSSSYK